jgi:uncharacterized membrane protein
MKFDIVQGSTEHISFNGKKIRRPTVLIRLGGYSMSKKAFLLGAALAICQVMDGLLTYVGLGILGIHMEGNLFLRELMHAYGMAPTLLGAKLLAIIFVISLALFAHKRRWVRPLILIMTAIYLLLAVLPWIYLISRARPVLP